MSVRCFLFGHRWAVERDGCERCPLTGFDLEASPPKFSLGIRPSVVPGLRAWFLRWWARPYTHEGERYRFRFNRWRERPWPETRLTEHERVLLSFLDELNNAKP